MEGRVWIGGDVPGSLELAITEPARICHTKVIELIKFEKISSQIHFLIDYHL